MVWSLTLIAYFLRLMGHIKTADDDFAQDWSQTAVAKDITEINPQCRPNASGPAAFSVAFRFPISHSPSKPTQMIWIVRRKSEVARKIEQGKDEIMNPRFQRLWQKPKCPLARAVQRDQSRPSRSISFDRLEDRMMMSASLLIANPTLLTTTEPIATITVNTRSDALDAPGSNTISLRDAITEADASRSPVDIIFNSSVFSGTQTISLNGSPLVLSNAGDSVSVLGPAGGLNVVGNGTSALIINPSVTAHFSNVAVTECQTTAIENAGNLSLTDVALTDNSGGGLVNYSTGNAYLLDDSVFDNSLNGYGGAGIYNDGGVMTLVNDTIANNSSTGYGGGILNYGGTLSLYDDTIANNSGANFGGGLFNYFGGTATIVNTIIAGNSCSGYGLGQDVYGVVNSLGSNLIGKTDSSSGWISSDLTGSDASPLSADFGPIYYNGGLTQSLIPAVGSEAIGTGNTALLPGGIATDQLGNARITGVLDIGAIQVNPIQITWRYGDELVVTAIGMDDSISISQSSSGIEITGDGQIFNESTPAAGLFVYTRGGTDAINIGATVTCETTVDSIDSAPTSIQSNGTNVIAWIDSTDSFNGTGSVNAVSSFAGGVGKGLGESLANPSDSGATIAAYGSLFSTGPIAADVNQGSVGDCYFMATLAAFANNDPTVLLHSAVDLGDGTFAVEFQTSSGTPEFIRVNNSFSAGPFDGYNFAYPGPDGSIWAMVMEKAFCLLPYGRKHVRIDLRWLAIRSLFRSGCPIQLNRPRHIVRCYSVLGPRV